MHFLVGDRQHGLYGRAVPKRSTIAINRDARAQIMLPRRETKGVVKIGASPGHLTNERSLRAKEKKGIAGWHSLPVVSAGARTRVLKSVPKVSQALVADIVCQRWDESRHGPAAQPDHRLR